ncbi:MAG: 50S ribosomal protein L16 [Candidatus Omnitrophica bacterium]|nr:50S ribosomal protein L16 [Candidatus Omnitrophota bacterium]
MLLMPKRVKYRKMQRGRRCGEAQRGSTMSFGEYGLQVLENGWLTHKQIEAARVAISRNVKQGKVTIRVFPDRPVTRKPAETRMGKGKGAVEFWVSVVKSGKILFEIEGIPEDFARETMRLAAAKIPFRTRFVSRKSGA